MQESKEEPDNLLTESQVTILKGHSKEVFVCSWNNKKDILATGFVLFLFIIFLYSK